MRCRDCSGSTANRTVAVGQQLGEVWRRRRSRVVVALRMRAVEPAQFEIMNGILDTFGD